MSMEVQLWIEYRRRSARMAWLVYGGRRSRKKQVWAVGSPLIGWAKIKKCNYLLTVLVHFCVMATLPCRLWWFETSASCQPGWKAVWTCQKQNAGRALAPHWWTPPSSPRTSQLAGGSRWCRGNAPASSASLRRPLADRRPAVPAAAPSAGRGGARGWWWTCPLWLLPPGHNRTRSALMLLTTIGLLSGR